MKVALLITLMIIIVIIVTSFIILRAPQACSRNRHASLVFEEDVENVGLVLEALCVSQQLGQSAVVDAPAGISGNAAIRRERQL